MTNASDFGALNWVKDELDQTIRLARQDLEQHVESADADALQHCADHLHQIAGVLQMVQVYGPGMLAEEMESVARAMYEKRVRQQEDAAEALMLALIQLPDYLESLQSGEADQPLIILPLLNDLRAVREAPLLSEASLFKPEIERNYAPERITGRPNPQLPDMVQRLRQKFHLGLLSWYRKQQVEKGWQYLQEVFDEIERHAGTQQVHRLFWLSGALVHGLAEGVITSGFAVKQLFGKIDRQLKLIIDGGEDNLVRNHPDDLLKNLLYYIAQAKTDDPRILEVKKAYELDTVLPSDSEMAQGRRGLGGSNAELVSSINDAMQSELTRIKDVLDLFMRNERADAAALEQLERPMRQLSDTLGMIGQGALRSRLLRQADRVKGYLQGATQPEEFELMEMAGDILYIESSLNTLQTIGPAEAETPVDEGKWGLKLPEGEFRNLLKQAVREAKVDIAKAKEAIIGFTESPDDTGILLKVHEGFSRVYGALRLLEFEEPAEILKRTADYIKFVMIDGQRVPGRQALNSLADVISSIEYFLEALVDGAGDRREIIAIARSALSGLLENGELRREKKAETVSTAAAEPAESEPSEAQQQPSEPVMHEAADSAYAAAESEHAESELLVASADKPALDDIEPEILEIFIDEAREELETIETDLPAWQRDQSDKNALISFRRSFHTLKGSGRLVGAKVIGELAWSVENMLNRVIDETISPSPEMMDLLSDVMRALPELIEAQEKSIAPMVDVDNLMQRALELAEGNKPQAIESHPEKDLQSNDSSAPLVGAELDEIQLHPEAIDEIEISSIDLDDAESAQAEEAAQPDLVEFSDSDLEIEVDSELLAVFANEAETHLNVLEQFIQQAEASSVRPQISEEVIRACHTLHGSARMAGISYIANLASSVEGYIKILAEKRLTAEDEVLSLLRGAVVNTHNSLEWLGGEQSAEPDTDSYLARLAYAQEALLAEPAGEEIGEPGGISEVSLESSATESVGATSTIDLLDSELFPVEEDPELVEIFEEEARELMGTLGSGYRDWCAGSGDQETIQTIRRGFHTLKGSARLAGIAPIGDLSHALEKVFNAFIEGRVEPNGKLVAAVGLGLDGLAIQVDEILGKGEVHWANRLVERLDNDLSGKQDSELIEPSVTAQTEPSLAEAETEVDIATEAEAGGDTTAEAATDAQQAPRLAAIAGLAEEDQERVNLSSDTSLFEVSEDPELLEVFVEEAKELLENLESSYQQWGGEASNAASVEEIKRTLHTLKGSARLAGVMPVGNLSHATESLFNRLAEGASESILQVIRVSLDTLASQVDAAETSGRVDTADKLIQQLDDLKATLDETDEPSSFLLFEEPGESDFASADVGVQQDSGLYHEPLSFLREDAQFEVTEDPELVESFIEEAREFMERLESGFQQWAANTGDHSMIDSMQRSLHTLKGSARLAGITPVGDLSHAVENLMTGIAEERVSPSDELVTLARQSLDKLSAQLDDIVNLGSVSIADDLIQRLDEIAGVSAPAQSGVAAPAERVPVEEAAVREAVGDKTAAVVSLFAGKKLEGAKAKESKGSVFKHAKDQVRVNSELMDRLVNNAGEVSIYRSRLEQQNNVLGFNLSELEQTVSRLHNQLRNLEIETEAQILYRWERDNERNDQDRTDFDPLELDRFSTMQQLSRALMETVNDLGNINETLADLQRETDTLLLQQSRIANDLQDGLLRTRMVPFMQLVPRLQRLVRQTADQLGKKAHLESYGAEGQLDRNILNRMVPVMEHLLRNAVSHGIESPLDRAKAEKEETGRISIYIDRQATDVLITLSDDGRGLDIEAIRKQAVAQGMIDEGALVSDDDLIQCVLNPGFSTAKEVTQIAGRGVGLDVVSSEIKQLGGTLDIDSQRGRGTSFTIRLPLTLAITNALLVRIGEEAYAIPHGSVEGVVRIRRQDLQACYQGAQEGYSYVGRNYKVDYLGRMMGYEQGDLSESVKWFPLLLVHAGEHHIALQVDELIGTRQIVVKSVGKQVGSVRWITGGTILADGRVALILDTGALVRMDATQTAVAPRETVEKAKAVETRIRVMVVDDSITVRKVTGRLLERNNMEVITAKDGVEAVTLLQEQVPDIMLLDIEMPRMDGFELARHINNSVDYYGLPIIMISSRVGEKHRKRAFDLGVKRCLGKPYQETELLENIREVLQEAKV